MGNGNFLLKNGNRRQIGTFIQGKKELEYGNHITLTVQFMPKNGIMIR
jgi:hypothetical protein